MHRHAHHALIAPTVLLLAFAVAAALRPNALAADPPSTYVRAGQLLDVRTGKMLPDRMIVIRGDRIERVAPASEVQIPAGASVVDLSHATVLPGLIDAHEHIF